MDNMPQQSAPAQTSDLGSSVQNPSNSLYQRWLQEHPSAGAVEKDVMKRALGGGAAAQTAPVQASVPAATPAQPANPQAKSGAIGRALGSMS
jgi:hypothetical protein